MAQLSIDNILETTEEEDKLIYTLGVNKAEEIVRYNFGLGWIKARPVFLRFYEENGLLDNYELNPRYSKNREVENIISDQGNYSIDRESILQSLEQPDQREKVSLMLWANVLLEGFIGDNKGKRKNPIIRMNYNRETGLAEEIYVGEKARKYIDKSGVSIPDSSLIHLA